ncbi:hypothetical protein [Krasilnikovia sp. MM14-A1259]|uniref:hypothetical protein n=1 Tax=Krasilnikovia sp. MM14-A1259 TaxID=3373539 RepID=UPI00382E2761
MPKSPPPWWDYRKAGLRPGTSYPLGRSLVGQALRDANAEVGSLVFAVPANGRPLSADAQNIIEVFWYGKPVSRYARHADRTRASSLFMRVWAVDSGRRHEITGPLAAALPDVCQWVAAAANRPTDEVWCAADHELIVRYSNRAIRIEER